MEKKIVVITGASAGLGRAIAIEFAKKKFDIGLIARNDARLNSLKQEIEEMGVKARPFVCDVSDDKKVEEAAGFFEKELGPIDIWVNNAMTSVFSPFKEISADEFKRVTEVTYLGYVYGTQSALKRMLPRDKGMIIQVGSALAYRGIPLQSAYCGSKHAIQGFTESLRCELLHDKSNVKITMVQMPAMNTPQFSWVKNKLKRKAQPVPPIFQPEVAAKAVVNSAFNYRREWYVAGSAAIAIIGNKFFPGFGDRYLAKHGYDSQQYDGGDDPNRPNNLYQTVDGNFGAHGSFDERAKSFSLQLWLDQHIIWVVSIIIIIALIIVISLES